MNKGILHQILATISVSLLILSGGINIGWSSPLLKNATSTYTIFLLTVDEFSWVVAVSYIGEFFSPVPTAFIMDLWGRKTCLLLASPLFILSWTLMLDTSFPMLCAGRAIQGIAVSVMEGVVPAYLGEIAGITIRGQVTSINELLTNAGILLAYILETVFDYRVSTFIYITIPGLFIFTILWLKDSPYYYLINDREQKAWDALHYYRDGEDKRVIEEEMRDIVKNTKGDDQTARLKLLTELFSNKVFRKAMIFVLLGVIGKEMSGRNVFLTYAKVTLQKISLPIRTEILEIVLIVIICVLTLPAGYYSDSYGRRPLFLISCGICIFCNVSIAVSFAVLDTAVTSGRRFFELLGLFSLSILPVAHSVGFGIVFNIIQCELFPTKYRAIATAIISLLASVLAFLSVKIYLLIDKLFGMYMNYVMNACCLITIFVYFFIYFPETKKQSFAKIQTILSSKKCAFSSRLSKATVAPATIVTTTTAANSTSMPRRNNTEIATISASLNSDGITDVGGNVTTTTGGIITIDGNITGGNAVACSSNNNNINNAAANISNNIINNNNNNKQPSSKALFVRLFPPVAEEADLKAANS